ncbi:MAG TPA: hypothetical protein VHA37_01435 [Candidatus Saccharimonadales bacterium]|nr:hypothetical protein [Candidatus Saccharimonadales bacterium]
MMSKHSADRLQLVERIIRYSEDAEEKTVVLKTALARWLLDRAKLSKSPVGSEGLTGRQKIKEHLILLGALQHRDALRREGMRKGTAMSQAAEKASTEFRKAGRNLAPSTIQARMLKLAKKPRK